MLAESSSGDIIRRKEYGWGHPGKKQENVSNTWQEKKNHSFSEVIDKLLPTWILDFWVVR